MAYVAYTDRQRDEDKAENAPENPYGGLAKASFTPEAVTSVSSTQPAAGNQLAGGSSGPSATGFVNFDRIFNANGDVAKRESGRLAQGAQNKAQAAQQGLTGAQQNFQNQLTGATARSPSMGDFQRASAGGKAADEGVSVAPVSPAPGQVIYNQPGNDEQQWEAAMKKGAAQKPYSGPGSLSETSDYDKLLKDTVAADDEINALQSNAGIAGMVGNPLDAALYGASGRPMFSDLGKNYAGLKDKLGAANAASQTMADQARKESQGAIDQYGILTQTLDDARKRQAAEDAAKGDGAIHIGAVGEGDGTLGAEVGATTTVGSGTNAVEVPNSLLVQPDGSEPFKDVITDLGYEDGNYREFLDSLGVTTADLAKLANMTPAQRKAWAAQRRKERGL